MEKPIHLLIIDDEPEFRRATRSALERRGFLVTEAENGVAGLGYIREERPDIVLLDLKMPGLSGIQTLEEIRSKDLDLPVLILTGHGNLPDAFAGINLEIIDFVHKPVDVDVLAGKISDLLARGEGASLRENDVRELMVPPDRYQKIQVDQPVSEAVRILAGQFFEGADRFRECLRSLLVYGKDDRFAGMLRFNDLIRLVMPTYLGESPYATYHNGMFVAQCKMLQERRIGDILGKRVAISPHAPLMQAISLMVDHDLVNLPVMEGERLIGILREKDIIREIGRNMGVVGQPAANWKQAAIFT